MDISPLTEVTYESLFYVVMFVAGKIPMKYAASSAFIVAHQICAPGDLSSSHLHICTLEN